MMVGVVLVYILLASWVLCILFVSSSSYRSAMKKTKGFSCLFPSVSKCVLHGRESQKLVCDITTLLRSSSQHYYSSSFSLIFFPYFMLVAFEGGSIFRAILLLSSCPLLCVLSFELKLRVMIFITFCGLRLKDMDVVARAVLPKFFLEDLNFRVFEVLDSVGSRLVFTSLPRLMVEGFLKDYLNVDFVQGTELHTMFGNKFFSGFLSCSSGLLAKDVALGKHFREKSPDIGIGSLTLDDLKLISKCKEAYVVTKEDRKTCAATIMPRTKYPKPLIFHDGRLAFFPTPLATLKMFIWLPFGIIIGIVRTLAVVLLPHNISIFLIRSTGLNFRYKNIHHHHHHDPMINSQKTRKGVLYVCNHRTLLDPVFLNLALQKPNMAALTYSVSRFSELISPMKTIRLTRDRGRDAKTIVNLLREGDLVVCPEGTTCREPYLLRFSKLFAELTDEIVPVAVNTRVTMFYGTTASGFKWLDHIFFAMNPRPYYGIEVLDKVPMELTVAGGKSGHEVANYVQRKLADALGFECTSFTRRYKYLMLAGNEGLVCDDNSRRKP